MARPPRIDFEGARHHVMCKLVEGLDIDLTHPFCWMMFKEVVDVAVKRYGIEVQAYVVMPDHYHMYVKSSGKLSAAMKYINQCMAQAINQHEGGRRGHLWGGRFKSKLVEDDVYADELVAYIHLNPERARILRAPPHLSSHDAYVTGRVAVPWLSMCETLRRFGSRDALQRFVEMVGARPPRIRAEPLWNRATDRCVQSMRAAGEGRTRGPEPTRRDPTVSGKGTVDAAPRHRREPPHDPGRPP